MISPAHEPSIGVPRARELAQRLGQALALDPERHRRRLAAGDHEPVEARRGRPARAPRARARRAPRASARAPRSRPAARARRPAAASAPTRTLPAAVGQELLVLELARSRASASPRRGPRRPRRRASASCQCVVASTIARGARRRVLGLEDARADEHALGAERHHQRGVGRRGDAAGAEQHDRQLALARRRRARGRAARRAPWRRSPARRRRARRGAGSRR